MNLPRAERAAMGAAGRKHVVEAFDTDRVVDPWEERLVELCRAKRR